MSINENNSLQSRVGKFDVNASSPTSQSYVAPRVNKPCQPLHAALTAIMWSYYHRRQKHIKSGRKEPFSYRLPSHFPCGQKSRPNFGIFDPPPVKIREEMTKYMNAIFN